MIYSALLTASLLKNGFYGAHLTWTQIGKIYGLGDDAVRKRVAALKKKYNIIDDEISPEFILSSSKINAPESQRDIYVGRDTEEDIGIVVNVVDGKYHVLDIESLNVKILTKKKLEEYFPSNEEDDKEPVVTTKEELIEEEKVEVAAEVTPSEPFVVQHIITPINIVVIRDNVPTIISLDHPRFAEIKTVLATQDHSTIFTLIDNLKTKKLKEWSDGRVAVKLGVLTFDGQIVQNEIANKILQAFEEDNETMLSGLSRFLEKCDDNPDQRVVSRIYAFIEKTDIRIDEDGDIYTYKVVRSDYMDKHTGKSFNNSPGKLIQVKRNQVDPREEQTCSNGLHVCAISYIGSFATKGGGDRIVLCKLNPRDVVSIPKDYNNAKIRCCEYTVVKDVTENFHEEVGLSVN